MLGNFAFLLSVISFLKLTFAKKSFRNTIRVSNSLDPNQAQRFFGPDLNPNCLQRLSTIKAATSGERVKSCQILIYLSFLFETVQN